MHPHPSVSLSLCVGVRLRLVDLGLGLKLGLGTHRDWDTKRNLLRTHKSSGKYWGQIGTEDI